MWSIWWVIERRANLNWLLAVEDQTRNGGRWRGSSSRADWNKLGLITRCFKTFRHQQGSEYMYIRLARSVFPVNKCHQWIDQWLNECNFTWSFFVQRCNRTADWTGYPGVFIIRVNWPMMEHVYFTLTTSSASNRYNRTADWTVNPGTQIIQVNWPMK